MFSTNQSRNFGKPLDHRARNMLGVQGLAEVRHLLSHCPVHQPTALHSLEGLARQSGIASLHVKDESTRLGLGSFKALGGAYAVIRLLLDIASSRLGHRVGPAELRSDPVRRIASSITVGCATDGNHGRSVAAGARFLGIACVIFVHSGVSRQRIDAMAQLGARIVHVEGTYDDSVARALESCSREGWHVVSDTSWPGYEAVPLTVMQGYTVMVDEALLALERHPTHIFLQAGVGGYAAAVSAFLKDKIRGTGPKLIVVEPSRAACLYASMVADAPVKVAHEEPTVMAMLECYEPSLLAWDILSRTTTAFMTVDEEDAINAMRRLADPAPGDPAIVAGESGGVGLAGLERVLRNPGQAEAIGLDARSRVLLFNTEGATDPDLYRRYVGRFADAAPHAGRSPV